MTRKRQTIFDTAIANIDEKIRIEQEQSKERVSALVLAKQQLLDEQNEARRRNNDPVLEPGSSNGRKTRNVNAH